MAGFTRPALQAMSEGQKLDGSVPYNRNFSALEGDYRGFVSVLERLSILHELGHVMFQNDEGTMNRYLSHARDHVKKASNLFYNIDILDNFHELVSQPDAVAFGAGIDMDSIAKWALTDEKYKFFAGTVSDMIDDRGFLDEVACDIFAVERITSFCDGDGIISSKEIDWLMFASYVNFTARNRTMEASWIEYIVGAMIKDNNQMRLDHFNHYSQQYSLRDVERYKYGQEFHVRCGILQDFIIGRLNSLESCSGQSTAQTKSNLIAAAVSFVRALSHLTGRIEDWSNKDYFSFLQYDDEMDSLNVEFRSRSDERRLFLCANGIS